ncbi:oligopeptide/dipeptide ABC transporter ATP-binding protein [Mesorhizobium sp. M6A.T.Cr.TU.016.01.1.1]|uniref:oligopeptide/dipeptide ABC transporter ATP-binding protein n=1 Tax=Mesorhizobium sp. M6A.T.Cr.TU.016.01.1.1 TaxID=2493677 RepID=UPI001FDF43AF|nr:oligopeptide/dipeptide ABC transporter ATP-binding protein [Mesorhizobium sp. M6A.T.Cr.TU.016.01.1.1]
MWSRHDHVFRPHRRGRTVAEIFARPKHPYTRLLIDSIPNPANGKKMIRPMPGDPPNLVNRPSGCAFHPRCPLAMGVCATEVPTFDKFGQGHLACHLHWSSQEDKVAAHA